MFIWQIILGAIIVLVEVYRPRKIKLDLLSVVNIFVIIVFVITPIISTQIYYNADINSPVNFLYVPYSFNRNLYFYSNIIVLLFYVVFLLGYYSFSFKATEFSWIFSYPKMETVAAFITSMALLSIFAILYINGGLGGYIESISRIHYGGEAIGTHESSLAFLVNFNKLILVSSYIYWGLKNKSENKNYTNILFYTTFLISVGVCLLNGGRFLLILYIGSFVLSDIFFHKRKLKLMRYVMILLIGFLVMIYGNMIFYVLVYGKDALTRFIQNNEANPLYMLYEFFDDFSYFYYGIFHIVKEATDYNYFKDLFMAPSYLIPRRIVDIGLPLRATEIKTSILLTGSQKTGSTPTSILDYGFINLGIAGVAMVSYSYGIIIRYISDWGKNINNRLYAIFYAAIVVIAATRIMYFDPVHFLNSNFYLLFSLLIIVLFKKFRI